MRRNRPLALAKSSAKPTQRNDVAAQKLESTLLYTFCVSIVPLLPISILIPSHVKSIQVNFGSNGHPWAQLVQVPLIRMEAYPHRQSLHYLHVVARRVLGGK
jgi:hypothetical protein